MKKHILIVEDHKETQLMLTAALEDSGFSVHCVDTIQAARDAMRRAAPCLLILDLVLPDGHGLEVCSWVRTHSGQESMPIIALTGQDGLRNKQEGFCAGVDQYLTKPIDMAELVMWVKALLRRVDMDKSGGPLLTANDLQLDARSQLVKFRSRAVENLTRREFELLYALVKNSPRILPRREILEKIWRTVAVENLVDTHMFNMRGKLPPELAENVQSVPGKGFRYFDKG